MNKKVTITGVVFIVTAIILGAFGAHALKELISPEKLISYETGVRYQMYHGLGLLIIGLLADRFSFKMNTFYYLQLTGVIMFSGSIYLLALQEPLNVKLSFLGPVTPIGGVLMILGWSILLLGLLRAKSAE